MTKSIVTEQQIVQVLLVSGREALLARLQLQRTATLSSTTAFQKKAFGRSSRVRLPNALQCSHTVGLHLTWGQQPTQPAADQPSVSGTWQGLLADKQCTGQGQCSRT